MQSSLNEDVLSDDFMTSPGTENDMNSEKTDTISDKDQNEVIKTLQDENEALKEKYLRLVADFDNYKKRTARERMETIQTAGKDVIISLLQVLDDSDRAEKQLQMSDDLASIKEGVLLVFNKLRNILQSKGLKQMQSIGMEFNPDLHEAISEVPTGNSELKGKVVDEVEKGYYLNDKIIRFAKVIVGK